MIGSSQNEKKKKKEMKVNAETGGDSSIHRGSNPETVLLIIWWGAVYTPLWPKHTPDPTSKSNLLSSRSFLGYALENRGDEREYGAEGID